MKHRQTNIGSLRKREVTQPQQHTEYYLFNSQGNLKAYSDDVMSFAYYGYNAANTRTYKLSLYNTNLWINGQQQPLNMQLQNAMFYPSTYLNFDAFGNYTKHYYNGMERIASRLGDNTTTIALNNNILEDRKLSLEEHFRVDIHKLIYETVPIDMPPFIDVNTLQPTGTPNDIYYYHPNHLGNTAFVTDQNQNITQGFLYAPFGEITTEYNVNFGNNVIPKYSFNAKELDEETGMFYYEARYYAPPTFTSRDPLFEKYFWKSPYAYCANNPVKYVDPSGEAYGIPPWLLVKGIARIIEVTSTRPDIKTAAYAVNNPYIALRTGWIIDGGKNGISSFAHNFSVSMCDAANLNKNPEGSPRNAIRHTLWQAILTNKFGAKQAERIGNVHESGIKADLSQRTFNRMEDADKVVDQLNNEIGRLIGKRNKGADNATMAKQVAIEFYNNGLWTASKNPDGTVSVQKTKISKEEYLNIINEINNLNNYGIHE